MPVLRSRHASGRRFAIRGARRRGGCHRALPAAAVGVAWMGSQHSLDGGCAAACQGEPDQGAADLVRDIAAVYIWSLGSHRNSASRGRQGKRDTERERSARPCGALPHEGAHDLLSPGLGLTTGAGDRPRNVEQRHQDGAQGRARRTSPARRAWIPAMGRATHAARRSGRLDALLARSDFRPRDRNALVQGLLDAAHVLGDGPRRTLITSGLAASQASVRRTTLDLLCELDGAENALRRARSDSNAVVRRWQPSSAPERVLTPSHFPT